MKLLKTYLFLLFVSGTLFAQFHNYKVKYGIQGHILIPSTEYDSELYRLSMLGRGFVRVEESPIFEAELGVGIGKLNGIDYSFSNWSTSLLVSDLRVIFSPINSNVVSPYLYTGLGLLNWKVTKLPKIVSPNKTKDNGWDLSVPVGAGIEINIGDDILLDIGGHYTFTFTDDLNYFNNPTAKDGYFDFGFGLTFVMGSEGNDDDKDGLSNAFEKSFGTDPNIFDTDLDGISDGDELKLYETDPLNSDSDHDGLSDYEEVITFKTDPYSADSDGDDLTDYTEINITKSNPNQKDSDNDNLSDGYEVNIHKTDPTLTDTDSDKFSDGDEVNIYKTNPTNPDTDNDGTTDSDEIFIYKTNPLVSDLSINESVPTESVPTESVNQELATNTPEILGVTFDSGSASLKAESEVNLVQTLIELKNNPSLRIEVGGYTDNIGNQNSNKKLSQERADAVRLWFVKKGIDALRIKAIGYGMSNPITDNNTEEGRIKNRRIEIIKK